MTNIYKLHTYKLWNLIYNDENIRKVITFMILFTLKIPNDTLIYYHPWVSGNNILAEIQERPALWTLTDKTVYHKN